MERDKNNPADDSRLVGIRMLRKVALIVAAMLLLVTSLYSDPVPMFGGVIGGLCYILTSLRLTELAILGKISRARVRVLRFGAAVVVVLILILVAKAR